MVLSAEEFFAIEKMAVAGMHWQQEDCDHAGRAVVDDEAVVVPLKYTAQNTSFTRLGPLCYGPRFPCFGI